MLTRLMDYLKGRGTTVFLTGLTPGGREPEQTETMVSSIVDALIILRHTRVAGVRHRRICVHKARGLPHSDEARELVLSADGPAVVPFPDATPGGEG
jgi:circadian clock protein KaiC